MERRPLKELAEISYGRPVSRFERTEDEGSSKRRKKLVEPVWKEARIMTVSALGAWPDSLDTLEIRELDTSREECFAQAGDIIVGLSSPFPCAYISEQDIAERPIFIPNSCALVRPTEALNPWYLVGYLSLDIVRTQVLPQQSGTIKSSLSVEQLKETYLPSPLPQVQEALAELTQKHIALENARITAARRDTKLFEAAFSQVFGGDMDA